MGGLHELGPLKLKLTVKKKIDNLQILKMNLLNFGIGFVNLCVCRWAQFKDMTRKGLTHKLKLLAVSTYYIYHIFRL